MGIYIEGLDMPKDGALLCVRIYPSGIVEKCFNIHSDSRTGIATARPVPEQGELINRGAIQYRRMEYGGYDDVGADERKRGILYALKKDIDALPAIDAKPTQKGYWKALSHRVDGETIYDGYECSVCEHDADYVTPYCPECGASLRPLHVVKRGSGESEQ